ncbi:hypothetical protein MJG53_011859 [Ovis ammon polii x Ovis aries]|uniref:Uncharacterized protein n=1 Tax=Ovis ammon polii x Ovis aries TaxID=2918886 RepID=A0ACB9UPK6_9CETA|nr:hypothetical protein MJG53_011859 [Ovis ammon polii x Ovis aries]
MASEVTSRLLFQVLLPCSLLSGSTKLFLRAVWATSVLFLLLQGALQVAFVSLGPEEDLSPGGKQAPDLRKITKRQGDPERAGGCFGRVDAMDVVRLLAPDIGMALVGLVTSRLGHELARPPGTTAPSPFDTMDHEEDETVGERHSMEAAGDDRPHQDQPHRVLEAPPPSSSQLARYCKPPDSVAVQLHTGPPAATAGPAAWSDAPPRRELAGPPPSVWSPRTMPGPGPTSVLCARKESDKLRLRDLGLQCFHVATLFAELLLPTALLLAGILQCRDCNEDLRKTTGLHNSPITWKGSADRLKVIPGKLQKRLQRSGEEEATQNCTNKASTSKWKAEESGRLGRKAPAEKETSDPDLSVDKLTAGFQKFLEMVNGTQAFLRSVLETHSIKLMAPVVIWLTLQEVSLMNSVFYILWVLSLPYSTLSRFTSRVSAVWTCVIVVCKVMYQLKWVVPSAYASDCTQNQLAVLALMTLEVTVSQRQSIHQLREGLLGHLASATLDTITRAHLDHGLLSALQYFVRFGFYKFGVEVKAEDFSLITPSPYPIALLSPCLSILSRTGESTQVCLLQMEPEWAAVYRIEKIKAKQSKVAVLQRGSRRPAFPVVSDDSYTFFETDSKEEEPQEGSEAEITDRQPKPRTAFQLAYKAWTNDAACALRMRMEDEGGMGNPQWDEEGLRRRHSGGTTVDSKAGFVWPSKRFWMAAIYYTEATVVVKYFSQFGLFPWTTKCYTGINREKPFSLPNILRVEKRDGFMLGDLVQLLALFFHRSTMQDSLYITEGGLGGERVHHPKPFSRLHLAGLWAISLRAYDWVSDEVGPQATSLHGIGGIGDEESTGVGKMNLCMVPSLHISQPQPPSRTFRPVLSVVNQEGTLQRHPVSCRSLWNYHSICRFFSNLHQPPANPVHDVYTLAFLVEVLNLVIILFGYWAFGGEPKHPQPPGRLQKRAVKYGLGGITTFALVFLMWFPLVFMSLVKTTLFSMSAQQHNLVPFSDADDDRLTQQYALYPFLADYRPQDIVLAKIKSHASLLWDVSPTDRSAMVQELASTTAICITTS